MADLRIHSSTSNIVRFVLKNSSTGQGLTGLDHTSSGLIISTIADNEATATTYTVAGSTVETISTLGTFAAPTATKCRFKAVDGTNHKGLYEFQFEDARFSVASAKRLIISVTGATNLLDADYEIQLVQFDPYNLNSIPDALLKRDMSAVTGEAARSPLNAFRFLRNKWSISGTTLTVTKEDDSTSAWTTTVTTNAAAEPITGSDPA